MPSSEPLKILLVEDNLPDARLVEISLASQSRIKFEIQIVDTLSAARRHCQEARYDAVLLDLSLPDSHGEHTVTSLREVSGRLPVIILSGQEDENVAYNAIKFGAQDYIVKGDYDGAMLTRIIMYAVERMHNEEELIKARDELEIRVAERTASLQELNARLRNEIVQRAKIEAEERRLEERYRVLLDNLKDYLVILLDMQANMTNWSKPVERLTGFCEDDIKDQPLSILIEQKAYISAWLNEAQKTGQSIQEAQLLCRNGKKFWAEVSINPLFEKDDKQFGYSFVAHDISQKRKLAEREREQLEDIAHLNRIGTMGEMATEIAHELNQPLAAISTYSSACKRLLGKSQNPNTDLQEALSRIEQQSRRAAEVIKRLRNFVAKDTAERTSVSMAEIIQGVVKLAEIEASRRNASIILALQDADDQVYVDRVLIEQVLLNLIRNGLESLDTVSGVKSISIETQVIHPYVYVRVKDQGKGVSDEYKRRIFDRFFTTRKSGMGMGLAICKSIIEAHKGELVVEDNTPQGAIFSFTVPLEGEVSL